MNEAKKQAQTENSGRHEGSAVKRLVMLIKGKWQFINYRKKFNGQFPIGGWWPKFNRYWMNDMWQLDWRGYAISVDMRTSWISDMIDPRWRDDNKDAIKRLMKFKDKCSEESRKKYET